MSAIHCRPVVCEMLLLLEIDGKTVVLYTFGSYTGTYKRVDVVGYTGAEQAEIAGVSYEGNRVSLAVTFPQGPGTPVYVPERSLTVCLIEQRPFRRLRILHPRAV